MLPGQDGMFFEYSKVQFEALTIKPSKLIKWELLDAASGKVVGDLNVTSDMTRDSPLAIFPSGVVPLVVPLSYKDRETGWWRPIPEGTYKARLVLQHLPAAGDAALPTKAPKPSKKSKKPPPASGRRALIQATTAPHAGAMPTEEIVTPAFAVLFRLPPSPPATPAPPSLPPQP